MPGRKCEVLTTSTNPKSKKSNKRANRSAERGDIVRSPSRRPQRASALRASEKIRELMSTEKKPRRQYEEYEVEDILSHTIKNGKIIYRISWVGYPGYISEMTEEDLVNCGELLKEYKLKMNKPREKLVKIFSDGINGISHRLFVVTE
ncbi:hypothetical protein V3C99_001259 [Haemonchus contortus]